MFNFGNADQSKRQAISAADGAVLITAGPGTGKTFTLVQRTLYLIEECKVKPENIFIATFTEKAAKELITRITNELAEHNISANINEMYVGTFHSLCLRILKNHLEFTRIKKHYRMLDDFDQKYTVFNHIQEFRKIPDITKILFGKPQNKISSWTLAGEICNFVNNLSEELVDAEKLIQDNSTEISTVGQILKLYQEILTENNLLDFASIQVETYLLLKNNPAILNHLQEQITHIMVDEYQDTNFIQEQLVFLLAGDRKNICVVGDDDQGLYRFRGATIRNILEFPQKFSEGECKIFPLVVNYRSESGIVDFYNNWMSNTSKNFFNWDKFRYDKKIVPHKKSTLKSPSVIKISSQNNPAQWHKKIFDFIKNLKASGKIDDFNQIAFLFSSVKNQKVVELANFLENNGINVYSPRSDMFFQREEIKIALGCLILMFPNYLEDLQNKNFKHLYQKHYDYYNSCVTLANNILEKNKTFATWIEQKADEHKNLTKTTNYAYVGLMYQMFAFEPFASILDIDIDDGVTDVRPTRNLAMLTQIIGKFEYLHKIDVFNEKFIVRDTEKFFNLYLKLLIDGGISEYEDDSEYAPSGCVSFLTIHQSKGMEFPIVFVDSLWQIPKKQSKKLLEEIEDKYFQRPTFEPRDQTKFFDFWRLYYTAFSRAQDLLILTYDEGGKGLGKTPSKYFAPILEKLNDAEDKNFNLAEFDFHKVKDVNIKEQFSFTSHIAVYETCGLQYKFYKELEFSPVRVNSMLFGILVHETIEDIHRAALRNEISEINDANIEAWFNSNYETFSKKEHAYLAPAQLSAALKQIKSYTDKNKNNWSQIKQAEVDVSLVKSDYIIEGKIDLIRGDDNSVEIVDFKSEKKPDENSQDKLENYRRQLHIYAYLVEQRTGQKVSNMNLYYTGEAKEPIIQFPYKKTAIDETIAVFDNTVHNIMNHNYKNISKDNRTCNNCDFKHYCKNRQK